MRLARGPAEAERFFEEVARLPRIPSGKKKCLAVKSLPAASRPIQQRLESLRLPGAD